MALIRNILLITAGIAFFPSPIAGACLVFGIAGLATLGPRD